MGPCKCRSDNVIGVSTNPRSKASRRCLNPVTQQNPSAKYRRCHSETTTRYPTTTTFGCVIFLSPNVECPSYRSTKKVGRELVRQEQTAHIRLSCSLKMRSDHAASVPCARSLLSAVARAAFLIGAPETPTFPDGLAATSLSQSGRFTHIKAFQSGPGNADLDDST
jgi:hypothetical protein